MFHRERKNTLSDQKKSLKDLTRIVTSSHFLAEEKRQTVLKKMRELSALDELRHQQLCMELIENLVTYCQSLPETTNSYYSQPGGLVDHALNRTEAALSLFQEYMVYDQSDTLSEEQKLWQYALYSAAILQGIGTLFVDYRVSLFDVNGQALNEWNPLLSSMASIGQYYTYEFQKEPEVEFRRRINLLLAKALIPDAGFSWIASNDKVLAIWLALLNEDERSAGTLGAILIRADAIAIQRYFTEFIHRHGIHGGSRYAGVGTFTGGTPETLLEKEQNAGLEFIQWMIKGLSDGLILINKAPLFMVPGGMLMCQELFQLFMREHPEYKNWQAVQTGFLSLGLHERAADGGVVSRFEHGSQMHSGIVFEKYAIALPASVSVLHPSGTVETMSSMELLNRAKCHSNLTQQHPITVSSLQKLNAGGQWHAVGVNEPAAKPGARSGA